MPRNLRLYHCLTCGAVTRRERGDEAPHCCGTEMVMAGETTVTEHDPPTPHSSESRLDATRSADRRERERAR